MEPTLEKIFEKLKEKQLDQCDLAEAIGIKPQTISDWKSGKNKSYKRHIGKIAAFLDVSADYLIGASYIQKTFTQPEYLQAQKNPLPEKAVPEQWNEIFKSMDIEELIKLLSDLSHELSERQLGQAERAVQKSSE